MGVWKTSSPNALSSPRLPGRGDLRVPSSASESEAAAAEIRRLRAGLTLDGLVIKDLMNQGRREGRSSLGVTGVIVVRAA